MNPIQNMVLPREVTMWLLRLDLGGLFIVLTPYTKRRLAPMLPHQGLRLPRPVTNGTQMAHVDLR